MTNKNKLIISVAFISFGVLLRVLPHSWNFTPVIAIALFAGVYLGKKYAIILPLLIVAVSDLFLGFYEWQLLLAVYGSYVLVGLFSTLIKKYKSVETVLAGSIISALLFFLITNFIVWQFSPWYSRDSIGLIECYTLALPFFRNSLLSSVFFTGFLFGSYEAVSYLIKNKFLTKLETLYIKEK